MLRQWQVNYVINHFYKVLHGYSYYTRSKRLPSPFLEQFREGWVGRGRGGGGEVAPCENLRVRFCPGLKFSGDSCPRGNFLDNKNLM